MSSAVLIVLLFYKARLSVLENFKLVQVVSVRFTHISGVYSYQLLLLMVRMNS